MCWVIYFQIILSKAYWYSDDAVLLLHDGLIISLKPHLAERSKVIHGHGLFAIKIADDHSMVFVMLVYLFIVVGESKSDYHCGLVRAHNRQKCLNFSLL